MLNKQNIIGCATVMLLTVGLLAACSTDDDGIDNGGGATEIRLNADCWQVMKGTRAATFDNAQQLEAETGGFMCCVYDYGTTTPYFDAVSVRYDNEEDAWKFQDGKHYWPAAGAHDFFAYMPATVPSYITDVTDVAGQVTYTSGNPQFKCVSLPVTNAGQDGIKEVIFAMAANQDKAHQGATGVALNFMHPFARINLKLSANQVKDVTINSITFKSVKNNGTYTHTGTPDRWALTGSATNIVVTLNEDYTVTEEEQLLYAPCLVIPQEWTGEIEVSATWKEWGETVSETLTTSVPTAWLAGYSYDYVFTISKYDLTVDVEKFTEQW